jgi:hypothetical protein
MSGVLAALRKLIFGETWTVPLGVAGTLGVALLARAALPAHAWSEGGGFLLAALVVATLCLALRLDR